MLYRGKSSKIIKAFFIFMGSSKRSWNFIKKKCHVEGWLKNDALFLYSYSFKFSVSLANYTSNWQTFRNWTYYRIWYECFNILFIFLTTYLSFMLRNFICKTVNYDNIKMLNLLNGCGKKLYENPGHILYLFGSSLIILSKTSTV